MLIVAQSASAQEELTDLLTLKETTKNEFFQNQCQAVKMVAFSSKDIGFGIIR